MDAAKEAIAKFTGRQGHTTEVEEIVNPAVTRETVKPHRHEEVTQAVDREVHQHHYHTTVQPISHQEVLPEKHVHNMAPVEQREFRHEKQEDTHQRVSADLARFKNMSQTHETKHTQAAAPAVTGEHVHHHVHETVQPIIHKETIQPEVVHTTVPIHEVHHATSTHHGLSALPMKSLSEFQKMGGILHGNQSATHESYEGAPREYNKDLSTTFEKLGLHGGSHRAQDSAVGGMESGTTGHSGMRTGTTTTTNTTTSTHHGTGSGLTGSGTTGSGLTGSHSNTAGPHSSNLANKADPRVDSDMDGRRGVETGTSGSRTGQTGTTGLTGNTSTSGMTGNTSTGSGLTNTRSSGGATGTTGTSGSSGIRHNSSLLNKLDPRVDADGDGKKGMMS